MQPEYKAIKRSQPQTTGTVLKCNKTLSRHHICSYWLRDMEGTVHQASTPETAYKSK